MAQIQTISLNSQGVWIDLLAENVMQMAIANAGGTKTTFDLALGPATRANGTSDAGCVYFLKDVEIPPGTTLELSEGWFRNSFKVNMRIFTASFSDGKIVRGSMEFPTMLARTGDSNSSEEVDMIIVKK